MRDKLCRNSWKGPLWAPGLLAASAGSQVRADPQGGYNKGSIQHVLLISIDNMHALDFVNCAQGISGFNGGAPYCPNLAELAETGVNYLTAATSEPSDGAGERRLAANRRRIL
jgi:hypothetical protein